MYIVHLSFIFIYFMFLISFSKVTKLVLNIINISFINFKCKFKLLLSKAIASTYINSEDQSQY